MIWNSWELLQVDYMFVGIVVIGILGLITAAGGRGALDHMTNIGLNIHSDMICDIGRKRLN